MYPSRSIARLSYLIICVLTVMALGCGTWGYSLSAVVGELQLLASTVPIEDALNDPALSDEEREKLAFLVRARDYAEQVVGLNVGTSYRTFVNLQGRPLAWNLSASRKEGLDPYIWNLPFVGPFPYLGFFDRDQAIVERDRLVGLGYDTFVYEVDAYSTLGLLPDPVTSTLLRRSFGSLADTVIHESLHNTIWRPGDTTFNESLANFVGRTASIEFIQFEFGEDTPLVEEIRSNREDTDRFYVFLQELTDELIAFYQSSLSSEEKIAGREALFDAARQRFGQEVLPLMNHPAGYEGYTAFPFNNAFVMINVRYNSDLDVFEQIYDMTGRNWNETLMFFSQATGSNDPIAFLQDLLAVAESGS